MLLLILANNEGFRRIGLPGSGVASSRGQCITCFQSRSYVMRLPTEHFGESAVLWNRTIHITRPPAFCDAARSPFPVFYKPFLVFTHPPTQRNTRFPSYLLQPH